MHHAAVGQRLDEPVGQGGFATVGDPAGRGKTEAGEPGSLRGHPEGKDPRWPPV